MGLKSLINVRCLEDLIARAPLACLREFAAMPECRGAFEDLSWPASEVELAPALLAALRRRRRDQLVGAEREAWRIERMASARGAEVLLAVAEQLNDNDQLAAMARQPGGEIGRAIWMRTHSPASCRLFEVAESIVTTGDLRGGKRLHDAFEIPCEHAPAFLWTPKVKATLEAELAKAMKLEAAPEVVHIELEDQTLDGRLETVHYLVVRFAGSQTGAVEVVQGQRRSFWYYPARDATLIYAPHRRCVEAFAQNLALRAPMANAFATHGFRLPLSHRPLSVVRYDLSAFARPLKDCRPRLPAGKVERVQVTEARALIGHARDTVRIELASGAEFHDVLAQHWGNHPFAAPEMLLRVCLTAEVVFEGQEEPTPLSITVAKPGRCSLQSERDPLRRAAGEQLLEYLGVRRAAQGGDASPSFLAGACRLLELAASPIDGFALRDMDIDIESFANEGVLVEGERLTRCEVESTPGKRYEVALQRCADGLHVRYRDPTTGIDVLEPAHLARRWSVNLAWLREKLLGVLGSSLTGSRGVSLDADPAYLGEMRIDGRDVGVYFAARMSSETTYRKVDSYLRLRPSSVAGIVLTTSSQPYPFAGTNVVVPIEDVVANHPGLGGVASGATVLDRLALEVAYRHGQLAARGGTRLAMHVSQDRQSGTLTIPGFAPWLVSGPMRIVVLERLVQAALEGPAHVITKILLRDTGCDSLDGLFGSDSRWRHYIERVAGTRAWRLRAQPAVDQTQDDSEAEDELSEETSQVQALD